MANIISTSQLTIDGDATPDPITCPVTCRRMYVRPNLDNVMNGWKLYAPTQGVDPFNLADGEGVEFLAQSGSQSDKRGVIVAGTIVAYGKANTVGSWEFDVECSL